MNDFMRKKNKNYSGINHMMQQN